MSATHSKERILKEQKQIHLREPFHGWCQDRVQRVHPCQAHSEFKEFKNQAESSQGQWLLTQSKGLPPSLGVLNL